MRILLVSGSTRSASSNTAALRTVAATAPAGIEAPLYGGLADLPAFNPDHDEAGPAVADLRAQLAAADAVLFCTPEYAGTVPGSLKNLLDWTVGSGELYEKPLAWLNVAAPGRGEGANATMGVVLGYVGAEVIAAACLRLPLGRDAIGPDGTVVEPAARAALGGVVPAMVDHLRHRSPAADPVVAPRS
jgi:chromate reductase, NAD(P)H dehydrogenase (quinone)